MDGQAKIAATRPSGSAPARDRLRRLEQLAAPRHELGERRVLEEVAQEPERALELTLRHERAHLLHDALPRRRDLLLEPPAPGRERELDAAPVAVAWAPFDEAGLHEPVDEAARMASLRDEQVSKLAQRDRSGLRDDRERVGLGRRHPQRLERLVGAALDLPLDRRG